MASCSHYRPLPANGRPTSQSEPNSAPSTDSACPSGEPQMHRYPHPIAPQTPLPCTEVADLHFLRCTLAYQNQLLADIKALLQTLVQQNTTTDT